LKSVVLSPNRVVRESIAPAIGVLRNLPMTLINVSNAAFVRFIVRKDVLSRMPKVVFKPICSGVRDVAFVAKSAPRELLPWLTRRHNG
jgi:hypothetical protein